MNERDLIPTFSEGEGHLHTALAYLNSTIINYCRNKVEQKFKVDMVEQKAY